MNAAFRGQVVVIVGASGGLGAAFARAFAQQGARLVLAGRNVAHLQDLAAELSPDAKSIPVDLADSAGVDTFFRAVLSAYSQVDVLVNAGGVDVRKPFGEHTLDDLQRTLDVNLRGAILLTRAFLPAMQTRGQGTIVHVGGFADGRLAMPYYSADVASRAGLFTFVEALNRELALVNSRVVATYFSPSPADTPAERPFHAIWREMGTKITSPEAVAEALLRAVRRRQKVHIMGGWATVSFARLNAAWPQLADALLLKRYGRALQRYLAPDQIETADQKPTWARNLALGLIVLSFILYGFLFLMPLVPFSLAAKVVVSSALVALGEATFWIGGLILSKEVLGRYKTQLKRFFTCWITKENS